MKNGNVRHYLEVNPTAPRLPLVSLRFVARFEMPDYSKIQGIANGLAYLHSQDIIHGDLKGVSSFCIMQDLNLLDSYEPAERPGLRRRQSAVVRLGPSSLSYVH